MPKTIIVQSSDGLAAWFTAVGTLALAVVAAGVALWSDKRTGARLADERSHSENLLAREQAFSRAQLEEERQAVREREQLTEAYAVQVVLGEKPQVVADVPIEELSTAANIYGKSVDLMHLAAVIVNCGSYTITRVEAQFSPDGRSMIPHHRWVRVSSFPDLPERVKEDFEAAPETAMYHTLTPRDAGLRFETDAIDRRHLQSPYSVVRWTDRWGTRWEHNRGEVRRIDESTPWTP
jgi:hypothetical protein